MVEKHVNESIEGSPKLDEGWWESVLAEEASRTDTPQQQQTGGPRIQDLDIDWAKVLGCFEEEKPLCMDVVGFNRGGLLVEGEDIQGFVPVSHILDISPSQIGEERETHLATYMGKTLNLKVIECDQARGRVVLSERAAQAEPGCRQRIFENLSIGDVVKGSVTNVTGFGTFIDLGGVEGLIHISELSWGRVRHPSDVLNPGEEVEVQVLQLDPERGRVALSLKRLSPNPWETAEVRYKPGKIIDATVTSVVKFGAFARIEEGLEGLIHVTEMDLEEGASPWQILEENQSVQVRVLHVDAEHQRIGLSMEIESPQFEYPKDGVGESSSGI
jgi:small subunit ribosomal protein S1